MFRDVGQALETSSCFSTLPSYTAILSASFLLRQSSGWPDTGKRKNNNHFLMRKNFPTRLLAFILVSLATVRSHVLKCQKEQPFPPISLPQAGGGSASLWARRTSLNKTGALLETEEKEWAAHSIYSKCTPPFTTNICDASSSVSLE